MKKSLTLACTAFLAFAPTLAFAQSSMENNPSKDPTAAADSLKTQDSVTDKGSPKARTPAMGTYGGRSAGTAPQSDPSMPNTDGLHPSGAAAQKNGQ